MAPLAGLRRRLYLSEIKGQFVLTPPIYGWPLCQQGPWWHLSSGVSWTDWIYHHCQALHFDLCQIKRNNITIFWTHYPFNNPNLRLWFISCCVTSLNHQSKFKSLPNLISSMILITCLWLGQIWVTWYEVLPSHAEISDILPPIGLPRSCLPLDAASPAGLMLSWRLGIMAFLHLSGNVKNVTVAITMSFTCLAFLDVCDLGAGLFNSCCLSLICGRNLKKKGKKTQNKQKYF